MKPYVIEQDSYEDREVSNSLRKIVNSGATQTVYFCFHSHTFSNSRSTIVKHISTSSQVFKIAWREVF